MWPAIIAGIASLAGTGISLSQQAKENERTREYNLNLAKQQNANNFSLWQSENAYNDPSAQINRLRNAGLNPDLIYGGGIQNTASSSHPATSGAAATPMDWSGARTIGDAVHSALDVGMKQAQIDAIEANTRKTLADAGLSEISLEYAAAEKQLGLKLTEAQFKEVEASWKSIIEDINIKREQLNGVKVDNALKELDLSFKKSSNKDLARKMAAEANISEAEAQNAFKYFAARLLHLQAENAWSDAAWIVQQKQGVGTLIKYGSGFAETILDSLLGSLTKGLLGKRGNKPKGDFPNMTVQGNEITWSN